MIKNLIFSDAAEFNKWHFLCSDIIISNDNSSQCGSSSNEKHLCTIENCPFITLEQSSDVFMNKSTECFYRNGAHCKHTSCLHTVCSFTDCPRIENYTNIAAVIRSTQESDPNEINMHAAGVKADGGAVKAGILGDFGLALMEVAKIGTGGLEKYSRGGWQHVDNGIERYNDAAWRHLLKKRYVKIDKDFGLPHMSHLAWNILAELELMLRDSIEKAVEDGKDRNEVIEDLMADMGTVYKDK